MTDPLTPREYDSCDKQERWHNTVKNELSHKDHTEYGEIISIIERARENAFRAVNRELISMYWEIGNYVCDKVKNDG